MCTKQASQNSRFCTAIIRSTESTVLAGCSVHNRPPSPKYQILPSQLKQTADRAAGLRIKSLGGSPPIHSTLYTRSRKPSIYPPNSFLYIFYPFYLFTYVLLSLFSQPINTSSPGLYFINFFLLSFILFHIPDIALHLYLRLNPFSPLILSIFIWHFIT